MYEEKKEEENLLCIEDCTDDCTDETIQKLKEYRKKRKKTANGSHSNINRINLKRNKKITNKQKRQQKWEVRQLFGYFKQKN